MIKLPMKDEYVNARLATGLSQKEFASRMGTSQSKVSKIESGEALDSLNVATIKKWFDTCESLKKESDFNLGDKSARSGVNARVNIISKLISSASGDLNDHANEISTAVRFNARKPIISVTGNFDAGKSTLVNSLNGFQLLPEGFQPTSRISCLIRHMNDKPAFHPETGTLFRQKTSRGLFDFAHIDDEHYYREFKVISGDERLITDYANYDSEINKEAVELFEESRYGVVYVDTPLLENADIIDTPGFGNNDIDDEVATFANSKTDVLIYCSTSTAFMRGDDIQRLRIMLPSIGKSGDENPLENLFIVITHAAKASGKNQTVEDGLKAIESKAPKRVYDGLRTELEEMGITLEELEKRFFYFSLERPDLNKKLEDALLNTINNKHPKLAESRIDTFVSEFAQARHALYAKEKEKYQGLVNDFENARKKLDELLKDEPTRKASIAEKRMHLNETISKCKKDCDSETETLNTQFITVDNVYRLIDDTFSDKKDAKEAASSFISGKYNKQVNEILTSKAKYFARELDNLLDIYSNKLNGINSLPSVSTFDANKAMLSGLAGLGSVGALATWAAFVAAGSNLGAYILVAKIAAFLTSIGISVGSGTLVTVVSTLGGPLSVAIGIGILVTAAIYSLFGDWKKSLAKGIVNNMTKRDFRESVNNAISNYWEDTRNAMNAGLDNVENEYKAMLEELEEMVENYSVEDFQAKVESMGRILNFYNGVQHNYFEQVSERQI